jgi:glyceraldehyde 3-phosphate dehydrogenase
MGNIIPASTGAAQAVVKVLPELKGKFHGQFHSHSHLCSDFPNVVGISIRVPVTNVSLVDLTVRLQSPIASKEELMNAFRLASAGPLAGVLRVSDEKLVSSDYLSSTESSIIDADATVMLDERTCKIVAWYDNEYGFASRSEYGLIRWCNG